MKVSIYIKGKCKGNPWGAGTAVAIIEYIDNVGTCHTRNQAVTIQNDTKNALMLKICITAIRQLVKPCQIVLYIDCAYLANAFTQGLIEKWQQNGWKRANGKQPANVEDWKQFYMLAKIHQIQFKSYINRYDFECNKGLKEEWKRKRT